MCVAQSFSLYNPLIETAATIGLCSSAGPESESTRGSRAQIKSAVLAGRAQRGSTGTFKQIPVGERLTMAERLLNLMPDDSSSRVAGSDAGKLS